MGSADNAKGLPEERDVWEACMAALQGVTRRVGKRSADFYARFLGASGSKVNGLAKPVHAVASQHITAWSQLRCVSPPHDMPAG
eukprot:1142871-Pelagomonas_calceolata.AAC.5